MNRSFALLILVLFPILNGLAQNKKVDKIVEEGRMLYRLEKGSWFGTDHFLEAFKEKRDSLGGYISYETENSQISTVFFSRFNPDEVLVRYLFDTIPEVKPISVDTVNSAATPKEKDLYTIRQEARDRAYANKDKFFTFYEDTALNFIPIITTKERAVFVLTGPKKGGYVLLGNDYKLIYNKRNAFVKQEKFHNSLLQFPYRNGESEEPLKSTVHSHIITDYITSTDICTLLLYKDYIQWKQHYVISEKQVSIFDLESEELITITRKAWDKIYADQDDD